MGWICIVLIVFHVACDTRAACAAQLVRHGLVWCGLCGAACVVRLVWHSLCGAAGAGSSMGADTVHICMWRTTQVLQQRRKWWCGLCSVVWKHDVETWCGVSKVQHMCGRAAGEAHVPE